MAAQSALDGLTRENYISLETFKKDGNGVKTPVWFARVGEKLLVFTDGTSYKVKRLSRNANVKVAACDVRGGVHGEWFSGTAVVYDHFDPRARGVYAAIGAKYTYQYYLLTAVSFPGGRMKRRACIEITLS